MKGKIVKDWSKVNINDPQHRRLVYGALNHFMGQIDTNPELTAALKGSLQHFGQPGDFPASVLQVLEKYHITEYYDDGWMNIFDVRDFTGSDRNGFDILDVEDGLTFAEVPLGYHADVFKMSGSKVSVPFSLFGGGLAWHRTLFDDKEYWTLEDNAVAFRNKAGAHRAQIHYDLIDAVGVANNLAWQAPQPAALAATDATYVANRDMATINAAAQAILLAVVNKGYGVTPGNAQFTVLCPLQLRGRIRRALSLMLQPVVGSEKQNDYNFVQQTTMHLASATAFYVILPKRKMKSGNRMNLTVFDQFSVTSYSDIAVGWSRFGAAIGDTDQIRRCASA